MERNTRQADRSPSVEAPKQRSGVAPGRAAIWSGVALLLPMMFVATMLATVVIADESGRHGVTYVASVDALVQVADSSLAVISTIAMLLIAMGAATGFGRHLAILDSRQRVMIDAIMIIGMVTVSVVLLVSAYLAVGDPRRWSEVVVQFLLSWMTVSLISVAHKIATTEERFVDADLAHRRRVEWAAKCGAATVARDPGPRPLGAYAVVVAAPLMLWATLIAITFGTGAASLDDVRVRGVLILALMPVVILVAAFIGATNRATQPAVRRWAVGAFIGFGWALGLVVIVALMTVWPGLSIASVAYGAVLVLTTAFLCAPVRTGSKSARSRIVAWRTQSALHSSKARRDALEAERRALATGSRRRKLRLAFRTSD